MKVLCSLGLLFCLFSSSLSQNYYFFQNKEGAEGTIDCEDEKDSSSNPGAPYIIVDEVKYTFDDCVHEDIYGLREKCDNETSCTFTTSNALVGSSCGTGSSVAGLYIRYHCVRDGAWTSWSGWGSCNRTCGGGYWTKTRTCTNPSPNIFSRNEACMDGRDYETERCSTGVCAYSGYRCVSYTVTIAMDCREYSTDGKITYTSTSLLLSGSCESITGGHYQGHSLASDFASCTNDHDCSVVVNRDNYGSCQSSWCCEYSEYDEDGYRQCTRTCYQTYSRCSQVYYYYTCTLPQWSAWSSWSSCTVTCGRGAQTRTRSCSTVSTDDAGTFNCEQTGSTHTSETRECLLLGSLPYCTYCGVAKFLYSGISAMTMNTDSNSGNAILLENNVDIIRCCGRVVSWNVYVKNAGTVTMAVMELTEDVDERRIVGSNTFAVTNAGNWESYSVPEDEQITIVADNRLMIFDGGANVVGYAACDSSLTHTISGSAYDYSTNYCPTSTYKMTLSDPPAIGDIIAWKSGTKYSNRIHGLQYKTTTNTPPTHSTSVLSASITDHSAVDTSVMSMSFSDTDYVDQLTRIVQEDHTYFYLNTKNMTVNVRRPLPHTVGTHEQTHTFYVWVQDTCHNRVTGTVTITTYNEPPYYTDMPKSAEIDEEQTGDLIPFAVVDDNNDAISCSVTSTEPSTSGMFEINNVNYTVSLAGSSVLNKDVSASYLVFFECTDGTDTAGSNVTIIVRRNITCEGEHEHYYYYNQTEDQLAELNCSQEIAEYTTYTDFDPPPDPYIVIDEIMYTFWDQRCENTQTYGVVNQCENKTSCAFNVTGATVYSWCGRYLEVIAGLFIRYHCVRDGAWSEWGEWGECSRTCNGGYRRRERNCSNPVPNYFSEAKICHDDVYFDDEKCNDQPCEYNGTTCRDDTFPAVCNTYNTNGFLTMVSATYTHGCAWNYNTADPAPPDVISTVRGHCDGNNLCPFVVGDTDLNVSCSAMSTNTDSFSYTSQYWCQQSGWYSCEQTVSDSLRHLQTMSYCGKLHWKYLCTVPQWEIWGQWSACTVTCGRGYQTRTRECLNEVATPSDGIFRTCSQEGSETHRGETRDCLLNGTHPYCTYCGENTYYSYKDVNEMSNTSVLANSFDGNALLFESDYDIIRCCGLIKEWTFFPVATGTIRFLVWRHTTESGNDFNMKVVGFNSYTVIGSDVGKPTTHTPSTTERIAVTYGDRIGVYYSGNAILGYETCDSTMSATSPEHIHYDKNPCPISTRFTTIGSTPVVDTVIDWNTTALPEKLYALQIKTTHNTAPSYTEPSIRWRPDYLTNDDWVTSDLVFTDGDYGLNTAPSYTEPSTRSRPDYLTYDDWVTSDLVFTDDDYGDFYKRVVAEENELFYLDTGEWRVRFIKSPLHELSTRYHYYNFTVWVEDSCHNRVTGTASIITYNAPPFFNNLAASVNISEHMTSGEVFEVDSEDREGDDYNTDITNTWPTTSIFYFNESRLMLVEGTALDKSILTYIVEVRVRDHNAGRRSNLTIQLIIYPVLQPIYYEYRANEGDIATLTMCNNETEVVTTYDYYVAPLDVYMIIDNVTYILPSFYDCLHNLTYGIRNLCENKTTCTFDVTNEHVTSSCGTDGAAALWIRYHCVRDAAWTTWNNWHDCTRSCGGGYRVRYRNCINPSVNYFGSNRSCEDSIDNEWERCNTGVCERTGDTCRDSYYEPVCDAFYTDGIIDTMTKNHWRDGCAFDFNTVDPIHYLYSVISSQCLNYHNCSVLVDDSLEPCFTDEYQTVNETYVTYKRSSWGWMSYPVTYWRYYTTRVISICGVFRWKHTCKIPQWAQWEQWSGCSQTCDRGYQTRTRVCDSDTISDTIDGYINRCGQFNDETHTLETRECLLAGNHRYCTYCEDRTFIYQDLAALDPVNDTDPGNTVILWSDIDIVRCCGLITSWSFRVMNSGTLKFIVWRSINVDGFYEVVGTNSVNISASDVNKTYTFTPDLADRMVIIAEDLISWYDGGANIVGYDTNCSIAYNASTSIHRDLRPVYCPEKTCKISLDKEPEDKDVFNLTDVNCTMERISTLNYTTTDNTNPYFNLTRFYKTIPDHSTIDFSLMDMYFNDSDYGDWFRNYYPDFKNYFPGFNYSFFYFDSFALTVHVRDTLPHTVGTQNYIHDFIIVAEDSCYNRITGTVTITTFNGPPVFSDLPKKVLVPESKTGAIASFTVEDPSFNDTIACKINRTVPEAVGFFFLSGSTVYINGSATLDRDVADEYEIKIHCSDGTDTTENFLKLEVTEETEDSEEPPEWIVIESVVVLIVTFVGVVVSIGTSYVVMFASTTLVVV